jgi:hypothetical protein
MANEIAIRPYGALALPDNRDWCERFEIHSATSNRKYIIAKNKKSGKFGCSCPSYRVRRYCKHLLDGCGLNPSQIHGNALADQRPVRKAIGKK